MKNSLENKIIAVIRVRGTMGVRRSINETLSRLSLRRVNNMAVIYGTKSNIGMIMKCKDFVTFGEITPETLAKVLERKEIKHSKEDIEGISKGKKSMKELDALPIRMHPPRHGYEGIKESYTAGGALGYRGEKINDLINRMA
ncbi:MAG: uL30 family ribosomal protein [Candidatus Micrarchaeota archaeon]|nr:uL30 family ribosomal protein [Candidatus Micrarchaeota archaeon]